MKHLDSVVLYRLSYALRRLYANESRMDLSDCLLDALHSLLSPDRGKVSWQADQRSLRLIDETLLAITAVDGQRVRYWPSNRMPTPAANPVPADDFRGQLTIDIQLPGDAKLRLDVLRRRGSFNAVDQMLLKLLSEHILDLLLRRLQRPARRRDDPLQQPATLEALSQREHDVLEGVVQRLRNREIAEQLQISPGTVKRHLENIYAKLAVSGRAEARLYSLSASNRD